MRTLVPCGEAQRVRLAAELGKRSTGRTFDILNEPATGLHFEDLRKLLGVLERLADSGNTVVVIEDGLDVIKEEGGRIVAQGNSGEVANVPENYTGEFLRAVLGQGLRGHPAAG